MIATDVERLEQVLREALMNEWEAQGHYMTGKVVNDLDIVVKQEANRIIISGFTYPYGMIQAAGVPANKIPFGGTAPRGQGKGGTSLYIEALQRYAKNRMNIQDDKKSLSVAFAIAKTHKKEGMPTTGSYSFSQTGKRTQWIEDAFRSDEENINAAISEMAFNVISVQFDTLINKWQYELNN